MQDTHSAPRKRFSFKYSFLIFMGAIVVLILSVNIYKYIAGYHDLESLQTNPQQATTEDAKKLVEKVGALTAVPADESPRIATISDVNKLKEQAFFSKAKNGDIVLLYQQSKRAILYDPTKNKVVAVGPISFAEPSPSPTVVVPQLRVVLYNGTSVVGLSRKTEKELTAQLSNVRVVSVGNAKKGTYPKTIVIDLTGKQATGATQIAQTLGGEVGSIPPGERKPTNADIFVILGRK